MNINLIIIVHIVNMLYLNEIPYWTILCRGEGSSI